MRPPLPREQRSLYWDGEVAYLTSRQLQYQTDLPPFIAGLPKDTAEFDFLPHSGYYALRRQGQAWRSMTLTEQNAIAAFIERVCARLGEAFTTGG